MRSNPAKVYVPKVFFPLPWLVQKQREKMTNSDILCQIIQHLAHGCIILGGLKSPSCNLRQNGIYPEVRQAFSLAVL